MTAFLQEVGGLVSATVFSTTGHFSICFRLLHFFSEKISAFLRMIYCPAALILYQELAKARTSFQEIQTLYSMTFQVVHRTTKYRSIWQCRSGQSHSSSSWLCISRIHIPLSVVHGICQYFRDMPPDAVVRYQRSSAFLCLQFIVCILRQNMCYN